MQFHPQFSRERYYRTSCPFPETPGRRCRETAIFDVAPLEQLRAYHSKLLEVPKVCGEIKSVLLVEHVERFEQDDVGPAHETGSGFHLKYSFIEGTWAKEMAGQNKEHQTYNIFIYPFYSFQSLDFFTDTKQR